jgi:acyl-coenzyme A thioesterase PaaI-like protein
MPNMLAAYNKCAKLPYGKKIFSALVCHKAPYFKTIKPQFVELRPGYGELVIKKRRSVENHIKSVHAIAMCNMSELVAGAVLETAIPKNMRWLPKKMEVYYLAIAKTDLRAVCEISVDGLGKPQELPMTVNVTDTGGKEVFKAIITMYLSEKKRKNNG